MNELEKDMKPTPRESLLHGLWIDTGNRMEKDAVWLRILWLTGNYFEKMAEVADGQLFRDPEDGRFWELVRTRPELPDGGPPILRVIERARAEEMYRLDPPDS